MSTPTEEEQVTAELEKMASVRMSFASNAARALRLGQLSSEQKLSYVLSMLREHQKETLILVKIANIYAEEHVAWKKLNPKQGELK